MRKKKLLLPIFLVACFSLLLSPVFAQKVHNTTCPVMLGERVKEKFYVDYNGEQIHFCCRPCVKAFKKNPGKYLKNLRIP